MPSDSVPNSPRSATVTRGLVLGKFLPYHAGHAHLVRVARAQVDELVVLVCSTAREPIAGATRFAWVRDDNRDCRVVHVAEEVPQAPEDSPEFWPVWSDLIRRHAGDVDVVFTSEPYGEELAHHTDSRHVLVDAPRARHPVSGTAIRANPLAHWDSLPAVTRPYYVRRVALLGTESVGKTTLAEHLARRFETVMVPEFGREYCEHRPALSLLMSDFEAIAWTQAVWEDEAAARANRVLICDTDLHTTATWSDLTIGARPAWLTDAARARQYDLVLLLDHDTPWVHDGTRVLEDRRVEHTNQLRAELAAAGREYVVLGGSFDARTREAERLVAALLAAPGASAHADVPRGTGGHHGML